MFFDQLNNKEKEYVKKAMLSKNKNAVVFYMNTTENGKFVDVKVMDLANKDGQNIPEYTYRFNNFELVAVFNSKGKRTDIVDFEIRYYGHLNSMVYHYNMAMGSLNKDYRSKALKYFLAQSSNKKFDATKRNIYFSHLLEINDSYKNLKYIKIADESKKSKKTSGVKALIRKMQNSQKDDMTL